MELFDAYNILDLFIGGTLLIGLIVGIWKGFLKSLTGLAGLVLGVLASAKYYPNVQPYLAKISSLDPHISMILSMILVFISVQLLFVVVRRVIDKIIDVTRLSWLDRSCGAAMGVAAGFLIVAATVQLVLIGIPDWPVVKQSRFVQPVDELTRKGLAYAPKSATRRFDALVEKWKGTRESSKQPRQKRSPSAEARQSVQSGSRPPDTGRGSPGPTAAVPGTQSPRLPSTNRN